MTRSETLIDVKFLNSSFSSSFFLIQAFRACPLGEIRQTVPCRAVRGKSSDSRQQFLSQQYPPPPPRYIKLFPPPAGEEVPHRRRRRGSASETRPFSRGESAPVKLVLWAASFMPMPTPKTVRMTIVYNKIVKLEVCITFLGRGMGMNITAHTYWLVMV